MTRHLRVELNRRCSAQFHRQRTQTAETPSSCDHRESENPCLKRYATLLAAQIISHAARPPSLTNLILLLQIRGRVLPEPDFQSAVQSNLFCALSNLLPSIYLHILLWSCAFHCRFVWRRRSTNWTGGCLCLSPQPGKVMLLNVLFIPQQKQVRWAGGWNRRGDTRAADEMKTAGRDWCQIRYLYSLWKQWQAELTDS